jgi:hypothetical protein
MRNPEARRGRRVRDGVESPYHFGSPLIPQLPYENPRPRYKPLASVSTADAEAPELTFKHGDLTLRFVDWREQRISLRFTDAVAFRWEDEALLPAGVRDDTSYEVEESPLVAELGANGALASGRAYRHFTFCFNEVGGVLQVVAADMTVA